MRTISHIPISVASLPLLPLARHHATESAPPARPPRFTRGSGAPPPPPRVDDTLGPDPEQLEKNLAEWLMTLALVAGVSVALLADAPSQETEQTGRVTQQNLGIFMLIGASSFALWAGLDYFRAASAIAEQLPVRGRTLRVVAFSLYLSTCFAGAAALPPRVTPSLPPATPQSLPPSSPTASAMQAQLPASPATPPTSAKT